MSRLLPSYAGSATAPTNAGTYAVIATINNANYLGSQTATLTINKAALTVTANPASKSYGQANPTFTASYSGLVGGQTWAGSGVSGAPSLTTAANASSAIGTYPITVAVGTLASANYRFNFVNGSLAIGKAPLTIRATSMNMVCGQPIPVFTGSTTATRNGEVFIVSGTSSATATSPAGTYSIVPLATGQNGASLSNYATTYVNGVLAIAGVVIDASENSVPQVVKTTPTTVKVKVMTAGSIPVPGIKVALYFNGSSTAVTQMTDATGYASFNVGVLPVGMYGLRAIAGGGCAEASVSMVVYNPTNLSVTGIGWIKSPLNTNYKYMSAGGLSYFGFVARYNKGATIPTGTTEFRFPAGNLTFQSTVYEGLTITGTTKAVYRGLGTINGKGTYGFLVSVMDGVPDKFRIKIWDKATSVVVYDNQGNAGDNVDATTAITGGFIIIQPNNDWQSNNNKRMSSELKTESLSAEVEIYPNPFKEKFTLRLPEPLSADAAITLFDGLGRTTYSGMLKAGETTLELDLRIHPTGMYQLHIKSAGFQKVVKVIKFDNP